MNALELQTIEQRLKEGYYQGDLDTLQTMQLLVSEVRRFRETAETAEADELR